MSDEIPNEEIKNMAKHSAIHNLRKNGPQTNKELPRRVTSDALHGYVGVLEVNGSKKSRGITQAVYYLYGDERRAVRKFIEVNKEFVESCMDDPANPINLRLDDFWWRMFREEWIWGGHGETEIDVEVTEIKTEKEYAN